MIYMGADHGGFDLKERVKEHLNKKKVDLNDLGT